MKRIALGITGSVAAIKAPLIARELQRAFAKRGEEIEIVPVLTHSALQFTTAFALSALTRQRAITNIWQSDESNHADDKQDEQKSDEIVESVFSMDTRHPGTWHVDLGRSSEAMLIAPCSASAIGALRSGLYNDPVTLLASSLPRRTPLVIAPAMDEDMWMQPAVQENLQVLRSWGVKVIEPVSGSLASGLVGKGRMPEPEEVVEQFLRHISAPLTGPLTGKRILITGGPTYEPIDAVRFIGNRSSGKMAMALANASAEMGAHVTLVMGPSNVQSASWIERVDIETAAEMREAVMSRLSEASPVRYDIVIMNAAVSDFTPVAPSDSKLKKREMKTNSDSSAEFSIGLKRSPDILMEILGERSRRPEPSFLVVGFALEKGEDAEAYARGKLDEKGLDMIVLNNISDAGVGFGKDTNKVTIFTRRGDKTELPLLSKEDCARKILEEGVGLLSEK